MGEYCIKKCLKHKTQLIQLSISVDVSCKQSGVHILLTESRKKQLSIKALSISSPAGLSMASKTIAVGELLV